MISNVYTTVSSLELIMDLFDLAAIRERISEELRESLCHRVL